MLWTSHLTRPYSATGPKGVSAILRGEACHITWNKKRNWMNSVQFIQESLFLLANLDPRLRSHLWRPSTLCWFGGDWLPPGVCNSWEYFGAPRGRWMIFVALRVCKHWRMITMSLMLKNFGMEADSLDWVPCFWLLCVWMILRCVQLWCGSRYFLHLKNTTQLLFTAGHRFPQWKFTVYFLERTRDGQMVPNCTLEAAWCKHLARCTSLKCSLQSWLVLVFLGGLF